jgi:hypothetical protein
MKSAIALLAYVFLGIGIAVSSTARTASPVELLPPILRWISTYANLPQADTIPPIVYLTYEEMQVMKYGDAYYEYQKYKHVKLREIDASYDFESGILYLLEDMDWSDERNHIHLVHEGTHFLQDEAGKDKSVRCLNALEPEAIDVTNAWIIDTGVDALLVSREMRMIMGTCPTYGLRE